MKMSDKVPQAGPVMPSYIATESPGDASHGMTTVGQATTQAQVPMTVDPTKTNAKAVPTIPPAKTAANTVQPAKTAAPTLPAPKIETTTSPQPKAQAQATPTVTPTKMAPAQAPKPMVPLQTLKNETVRPSETDLFTVKPTGTAMPTVRPAATAAPTATPPGVSPDALPKQLPKRAYERTRTMGGFEYSITIKPTRPTFYKNQFWVTLFMFNPSEYRLCFKIEPPSSKYFTITPLSGFIEVGKSSYVAIRRMQPIEYVDKMIIEFGPDTGVQQAAILFDDAYCDSDRIKVPITATLKEEPKRPERKSGEPKP